MKKSGHLSRFSLVTTQKRGPTDYTGDTSLSSTKPFPEGLPGQFAPFCAFAGQVFAEIEGDAGDREGPGIAVVRAEVLQEGKEPRGPEGVNVQPPVRRRVGLDPFQDEPISVFFQRGIHEDENVLGPDLQGSLGKQLVSQPKVRPFACPFQVLGQERRQVVAYAVILPEGVAVTEDAEIIPFVRQFLTSPFRVPSAP